MKISVSWILDHIKVTKKEINVATLVEQLNACTAEIEAVVPVQTDTASLFIARTTEHASQTMQLECPELKKQFILPARTDVTRKGSLILVKKEGTEFRTATLVDLGSEKEGLMPALWLPEAEVKGLWRETFENEDHILHIDNKALTNRPDLWGHRGFAREVAALIGKELRPEEDIIVSVPIKHYDSFAPANGSVFSAEIQQGKGCDQTCRRFSMICLPTVEWRASLLPMATRLARIDSRPLEALVDMTNYVMFDMGQPMHAFDADMIKTKKIVGRCAHEGEKLLLLDKEEVTLSSSDYVITDGEKPLALAGIMGGLSSAVHEGTRSVLLEAADFDPGAIRKTSTRLKKRTESSARFEKSLDPNQNTSALLRYLKLLTAAQIPYTPTDTVTSLGPLAQDKVIELTHVFIEKKIGTFVSQEKVEQILIQFGFGVVLKNAPLFTTYIVTVPTFRSTKDVTLAEDIVEEVVRSIGYSSLPPVFPVREMKAFNTSSIERLRAVKKLLAYGFHMREVSTYAFYHEEFLHKIQYDPTDALRVANPLSEQWQRLVTSLIPNLLQCVAQNEYESMRFFECARVWFMQESAIETEECAGIWYEKKQSSTGRSSTERSSTEKTIDFYEGKALVEGIFDVLQMSIRWAKPTAELEPWYDKNQTAELWLDDRIIGRAGMMSQPFLHRVAEGEAFIFELDANALFARGKEPRAFTPLRKYPSTDLDISMLVPVECTVFGIEQLIKAADNRIISVQFIDSFERPEWVGKKSVTFRFVAYDPTGTLTEEAIDLIWNHVVKSVASIGAQLR